jgi:hypothetical protein
MHKNKILALALVVALLFGRTFLAATKALSQPAALSITSEDEQEHDEETNSAKNTEDSEDHEENSGQNDESSDEEDAEDVDDAQLNEDDEEEIDGNGEDTDEQGQGHDENSGEAEEDEKEVEDHENNDDVENEEREKEEEETSGEHGEDEESESEEEEYEEKDEDEDGVDDHKESEEEREIEVEAGEEAAEVKSKIKTENMTNEFEIKFESDEGVEIELEYKNDTQVGENETEIELELSVKFLAIVEYFDNDTSGSLTDDDTIIQVIDLKELEYTRPEVTNIISADGEAGYRLETVGTLGEFKFNITAVIFSTYAIVNNTLVSPTETKITINITNFPYKDQTGTSAIALQIRAVSKMEIEEESETTEREIKVKSKTAEGYFSWENWVLVDGAIKPVNSSISKEGNKVLINLCYPRGASIIHDPRLGVGILAPIFGYFFTLVTSELLAGTGIMAMTITLAAIALTRVKKSLLIRSY